METYGEKFVMDNDKYLYLRGTKSDEFVSLTLFMNDIKVTMSLNSEIVKDKDLKEMVSSSCKQIQKMDSDMDGKVFNTFRKYQERILAIRRRDLEEDDSDASRLHNISYHVLSSALSQAMKNMEIFHQAEEFYTYNSNRDLASNKISPLAQAGDIAKEILKER